MACTTLVELVDECENNMGGGQDLLYNDQSSVPEFTVDTTTKKITAFTGMEAPFIRIPFRRNAVSYMESEKIDRDAGSNYMEATVSVSLKKRDAKKSEMLRVAGQGQRYLAFVFKDGNGTPWYFQNMQLATSEGGSGANKAEGSKYDVTFVGEYEGYAYPITDALYATLTDPITP